KALCDDKGRKYIKDENYKFGTKYKKTKQIKGENKDIEEFANSDANSDDSDDIDFLVTGSPDEDFNPVIYEEQVTQRNRQGSDGQISEEEGSSFSEDTNKSDIDFVIQDEKQSESDEEKFKRRIRHKTRQTNEISFDYSDESESSEEENFEEKIDIRPRRTKSGREVKPPKRELYYEEIAKRMKMDDKIGDKNDDQIENEKVKEEKNDDLNGKNENEYRDVSSEEYVHKGNGKI
ncbi:hypothetical protein MHBO_004473, partial [Bonamia ostreae]